MFIDDNVQQVISNLRDCGANCGTIEILIKEPSAPPIAELDLFIASEEVLIE